MAFQLFSLEYLILPFNAFITIFYSLEKWANPTYYQITVDLNIIYKFVIMDGTV